MDRKHISTILVFILTISFVIVCILLFINGNKYKKLIGIKFKLGALILSMQSLTSCFSYHYGTCYRPVSIPPLDNEKQNLLTNPHIGFTANIGLEQNVYKIDNLSSLNFGLTPNFHKMSSSNTYFCGIILKNYINKNIYNGTLLGINTGISHITYYKINYFTSIDVNIGSNKTYKFYDSYGINVGTRINNFLLFQDNNLGLDIYGRFEYNNLPLQFHDNLYIGLRIYYGFFGQ